MRVKMLTSMAGPSVDRSTGDEIEVEDNEATRLIEAGYAEPVRGKREQATSSRREKAVKE